MDANGNTRGETKRKRFERLKRVEKMIREGGWRQKRWLSLGRRTILSN